MIEIQAGYLVQVNTELVELMRQPMPIDVAYRVGRIYMAFIPELRTFSTYKQKLLDKHGNRGEDGQLVIEDGQVKIDNMPEFHKEFNKLAAPLIRLPCDPVPLKDLGDSVLISPQSLQHLIGTIIVEEKPEEEDDG